ncbi:zinc finger C2H2 domain-containing protein [Candidatus Nitrososphaera gargensis Ga9.2]|uniref:Zinc finger C2H2 domain-containing protein n=1 Tax=Nitrososphaera gargensis (strain Ga9.2) TaxID=1237085 RepID=K0IJN7_NITGG|nr:hypothetical protein [Candidatus Nitrososphaera gargensis]AFU60270.1 zinc finger C2H2 domain-containing protein [Candidatus Nitrososphaera gargensis Ga9.2]
MPSTTVPSKIEWPDILNESVHTSDDVDIGDIYALSRDFVVVKRGIIHKIHYYYIPINKVEGWDGNVLWLKITEDEVKRNYERDRNPNPLRYSLKDYPAYSGATYPELMIISPKGEKIAYTDTTTAQTEKEEERVIYKCDLCDSQFRTEEELSRHVPASH